MVVVLMLVAEMVMAMARVVVEMLIAESLMGWSGGQGRDDGCMAPGTVVRMAALRATGDCTMAALGLGWSSLPLL
jgi:hypothetical protein